MRWPLACRAKKRLNSQASAIRPDLYEAPPRGRRLPAYSESPTELRHFLVWPPWRLPSPEPWRSAMSDKPEPHDGLGDVAGRGPSYDGGGSDHQVVGRCCFALHLGVAIRGSRPPHPPTGSRAVGYDGIWCRPPTAESIIMTRLSRWNLGFGYLTVATITISAI